MFRVVRIMFGAIEYHSLKFRFKIFEQESNYLIMECYPCNTDENQTVINRCSANRVLCGCLWYPVKTRKTVGFVCLSARQQNNRKKTTYITKHRINEP